MSSISACASVSVLPVIACSGRPAICARISASFREPSNALPMALERSGFVLAGPGRIADGVRAFHHLQVDHGVALALAQDHRFTRDVAQPLEHRQQALGERILLMDLARDVVEAARGIQRARPCQRIEITASGQRGDDRVATALRDTGGFGQIGQRQRLLAPCGTLRRCRAHARPLSPRRRPRSARALPIEPTSPLVGISNIMFDIHC